MIDESTARALQDKYLGGERGALGGLYAELRELACIAIKSYARQKGTHYEDVDEMAHQVASKITERYLKGEYRIRHFYELTRRECLHLLTEGARTRDTRKGQMERATISWDAAEGIVQIPDYPEDRAFYIAEIVASAGYGGRVVIALFYSRSWRGALRTISKYATEQWMVNQMHRLRDVYGLTHGKERSHGVSGRRGVAGNKTTVRLIRPQVVLCGERDAQTMVSGEG